MPTDNTKLYEKHQALLVPFFERQKEMVGLLLDLSYPIARFLTEERTKVLQSAGDRYKEEDFSPVGLAKKPPTTEGNRTGSALGSRLGLNSSDEISMILEPGPLRLLHLLYLEANDTRSKKSTYKAGREKFVESFMPEFSYAVVLQIYMLVGNKSVKEAPITAAEQLSARRKLDSHLADNEATRDALLRDNMGLAWKAARTMVGGNAHNLPDIAHYGSLGILEAVNRYLPSYSSTQGKAAGFAGLASNWVRHVITRTYQKTAAPISTPAHHKERLKVLRAVLEQNPHISDRALSLEILIADRCKKVRGFATQLAEDRKGTIKELEQTPAFVKEWDLLANGLIRELRQMPTTESLDQEGFDPSADRRLASNDPHPEAAICDEDTVALVRKALSKLSPQHRLALALTYGLRDAKDIGRDWLQIVLSESTHATRKKLSDRPNRPLSRIMVGEALASNQSAVPSPAGEDDTDE